MLSVEMDPAFITPLKQPKESLQDARVVRQSLCAAQQENQKKVIDVDLLVEDHLISASDDLSKIPVRLYRRRDLPGPLPVLLYLHGGGFFCGDLSSEELQCSYYAKNACCAVICVAYRLAPEEPFPAALNDCYRILEFLWNESGSLRLNRSLLAVGGSSAGANLAAAVALLARDRIGPKICFQMLLIPALDDRLETPSARQFTDLPDFARPEAEVMWRWYLGEQAGDVSVYAAPARVRDLSDLPRTYVLCAGLDPLKDEGLSYAHRLGEAGVSVELHLVPTIPHGFASFPSAAVSQRLLREQADVLRSAFSFETGLANE